MKIIEVNKCSECPYLIMSNGYYLTQCKREMKTISENNIDKMPRWCPLKNKKDLFKE